MAIREFKDLKTALDDIDEITELVQGTFVSVTGFLNRLVETLDKIVKEASRHGKLEYKIEKRDIDFLRTYVDSAQLISRRIRSIEPSELFDLTDNIENYINIIEDYFEE